MAWHDVVKKMLSKQRDNNIVREFKFVYLIALGPFCVQIILIMKICYFLAICGLKRIYRQKQLQEHAKNI